MRKFHHLKQKVEAILRDVPASRDSDVTLTIEIWKEYFPKLVLTSPTTGRQAVLLSSLYDLPREDNVKRIRAHFQNDLLKYLPTSLEVAKQRKISEEVWRKTMGQGDVYGRIETAMQG